MAAIFNFGQTGVYVFFLISGFIIVFSLLKSGYSVNKFFTFLLKRSVRIDPPYYIVLILTVLLYWYLNVISPLHQQFNFIPQQFISHLLYIVPFTRYGFYMHIFWTLCVEFQFYLLIGLIYFLSANRYFKILFLLTFSLSSFLILPASGYLVFTYAAIFSAGISLVDLYQNYTWQNALMPCFCLGLAGYKFGFLIFLLLAACCIIILFSLPLIRSLRFLGDISYSLYLTHTLTLIVFSRLIIKVFFNINNYPFLLLITETIFAVIIAYFFYLIVERPSLRFSKIFSLKSKNNRPIQNAVR